MSYLDNLSPEMRAAMLRPSRDLTRFKTFAANYRAQHPNASMNEIQEAYQFAENAKLDQ